MENTCGEDLAICMQSVRRQLVCPNENTVVGLCFFTVCHLCLLTGQKVKMLLTWTRIVLEHSGKSKSFEFFSLLLNLLHSHPFLLRQGNTWGCQYPYAKKIPALICPVLIGVQGLFYAVGGNSTVLQKGILSEFSWPSPDGRRWGAKQWKSKGCTFSVLRRPHAFSSLHLFNSVLLHFFYLRR